MSKSSKRKSTAGEGAGAGARPSVFERLGTKKGGGGEPCRQWAAHGVCAYGKSCKYAATHSLVSPSKRAGGGKEEESRRLHSAVVRPDELESWDQTELEYADTDALEKRRQQLQRELELQLRMETGGSGPARKDKKPVSSSSSSRSSSSSSASSSSTDGSSSSSSSARDPKKRGKRTRKRNSSSSSADEAPSKKKPAPKDTLKRTKPTVGKKTVPKKDDRPVKKHDTSTAKKKVLVKMTLGKKSLSPGKKTSTPPITTKSIPRGGRKHSKSPIRRKNRSITPKDKERDRRERERERDRDKDRDRAKPKSRSPLGKQRSRSTHRNRSLPKDPRIKLSSERSRPISPRKARRDQSSDKHRKRSPSRNRRDHKDKSSDRRKDLKHDDKDKSRREKEKPKEPKREPSSKRLPRERVAETRRDPDRGLEKPSKPMERLLPRPEERLAALAAISNRNTEPDKASTTSKERIDSDRGRKGDRDRERDRSGKRERISMDRDHGEYDHGLERPYDRGHSLERVYERGDRYEDGPPGERDNRSPGYGGPGRDRHYEGYDMPGHPRGYQEGEERYVEHIADHRDIGFDERRPRRDHSWEGRRSGSMERERPYHPHPHPHPHPHKEWEGEGEEFHGPGEWRDRHWQHREPQIGEWGDKEGEVEAGWHHRGHPPGPHRPRMHDEGFNRNMDRRMDHPRADMSKRRSGPLREPLRDRDPPRELQRDREPPRDLSPSPNKPEPPAQLPVVPQPAARAPSEREDEHPIPDDLSEISDDPDDILNRDDMIEQRPDEDSLGDRPPSEERANNELTETLNNSAQDSPPDDKPDVQDSKDEDKTSELDFEEISEGELEEERARAGLGDALGVDWASLVAEVRRNKETADASGGAQQRWQPERVLARVGVSLAMCKRQASGDAHPVPSIQVAIERRKRLRAALFGSGCETRALSARRDLALRRHLCNLPPVERSGHARISTQPSLFHAARALLMQTPA